MEIAAKILAHHFDAGLVQKIHNLRASRVQAARLMLSNLEETTTQLLKRGMVDSSEVTPEGLRAELTDRINQLSSRLDKPETIYPDEIALLIEMLND